MTVRSRSSTTPTTFGRVFATLAVHVVLGPLIGAAFALLVLVPLAVVTLGPSVIRAIGSILAAAPWLPYSYGLLPAALVGIVVVLRERMIGGPVPWRHTAAIGLLVGLVAGLFSFGRFPATNPYLVGLFAVSGLAAALGCRLALTLLRRWTRT
ncbi:hypothetical protein GGR25_003097 [Kaistia hirudinis]|uniref:Uncharacterized protein n=1 Tax=Kaistia hirudinis TaxID=1293440 RepID=A0A840AP26_9HYPH|nr:hypothetical protein [Kaistia hirudinis]MBB3932039.1 hypothetical protein [Kaistia hirudinis]